MTWTKPTALTAVGLAALVAAAVPASAQLSLLPEGPLEAVDGASGTACAAADACLADAPARTVYHKGYIFTLSPGAIVEGGTVVSLGGSQVPSTSVSRIQGGSDAVTVRSGDKITVSYLEATEGSMDTYALSAVAIGNYAWMILGADVQGLDESVILGWATAASRGSTGQTTDVDAHDADGHGHDDPAAAVDMWGAVCLAFHCGWHRMSGEVPQVP